MNILFLTEGTTIPASRFRVGQFIEHFEARGVQCTVRAGYGKRYNQFAPTRLGIPYKAWSALKRFGSAWDTSSFDLVFVQRPALPFSAWREQLIALRNPRIIFDVDDAIFLAANGKPDTARRKTFDGIVALSSHVICGNNYLAEQAGHPNKTTIIPTVIDTELYIPSPHPKPTDKIVIGWMGTAGNFVSVRPILPVILDTLAQFQNTIFRIVSNARLPELDDHPQVEQIAWSSDSEIELLQSFDIGLMPLLNNDSTRGKCAFKMIQYMAVGRPVVVSAVGANVEVFEGSNAGYLVSEAHEWKAALSTLIEDKTLREAMGASGRCHAVEKYSILSVIDTYMQIFKSISKT